MIHEINCDLLRWFDEQKGECGILHSCNCFQKFGTGIALLIKEKYPLAYEADLNTKRGDINKLGTFSYIKYPNDKYIYNLYGQFAFGRDKRYTNYDAVCYGLEAIKKHAISRGLKSLGLPFNMGSGLGGGSWRIIRAIIDDVFLDNNIDVFICRLN